MSSGSRDIPPPPPAPGSTIYPASGTGNGANPALSEVTSAASSAGASAHRFPAAGAKGRGGRGSTGTQRKQSQKGSSAAPAAQDLLHDPVLNSQLAPSLGGSTSAQRSNALNAVPGIAGMIGSESTSLPSSLPMQSLPHPIPANGKDSQPRQQDSPAMDDSHADDSTRSGPGSTTDTPTGQGKRKSNAGGGGASTGKKRTTSCENCRRRKLKCDRRAPCGACIDRGEASNCTWEDGVQPITTGRDTFDAAVLSQRMDRMEAILGAMAGKMGIKVPAMPNTREMGQKDVAASALAGMRYATSGAAGSSRSGDGDHSHGLSTGETDGFITMSLGWQEPEDARREAVLWKVLELLPDTRTVRAICESYLENWGWYHYVVTPPIFWNRLKLHEENRLMWKGRAKVQWGAQLRSELTFVALLLVMLVNGIITCDRPEILAPVFAQHESPIATYLDAAMKALDAVDALGHPTLDTVRTSLLVQQIVSGARGEAASTSLAVFVIQQAFNAGLDLEPPADLPKGEVMDRMKVWSNVCMLDWFGQVTSRRRCMIGTGGSRPTPSFLYNNASWELATVENGLWPIELKIRFELGRIMRRAIDRDEMSEEESYQLTTQLQAEVEAIARVVPPELRHSPEDFSKQDLVKGARGSLVWRQLMLYSMQQVVSLHLHRRYYVSGWLDRRFAKSKDTCFEIGRMFMSLFVNALGAQLDLDGLLQADSAQQEEQLQAISRRGNVSMLMGSAKIALSSALLLQHHVLLVEMHPAHASMSDVNLRPTIVNDLKRFKEVITIFRGIFKLSMDEVQSLQNYDIGQGPTGTNAGTPGSWASGLDTHGLGTPAGSASNGKRSADIAMLASVGADRGQPRPRTDFDQQSGQIGSMTGSFEQDAAQISSQPWFQTMESLQWGWGPAPGSSGADIVGSVLPRLDGGASADDGSGNGSASATAAGLNFGMPGGGGAQGATNGGHAGAAPSVLNPASFGGLQGVGGPRGSASSFSNPGPSAGGPMYQSADGRWG